MKSDTELLLKQIFSIPLDGEKFLIYAPLKGIAFIANPALVNILVDHCSWAGSQHPSEKEREKLKFFYSLGFFTPELCPPDEYVDNGIQYDAAILFLTNRCNLRCSYCYASSGEFLPKNMKWEIARAAIDYAVKKVIDAHLPTFTLGFHGGGEPTLNWDVLTQSVEYARDVSIKNNLSLQVTGAFNGYWTKEARKYILENFTEISLSFDGLPQIQNRQRPAVCQKDSFGKVAETLSALDEANFSYGIRMTVTNDSVHLMAENIAFICENFRPRKIQVEPVFLEGRARENQQEIADLTAFVEQFSAGHQKAVQHNIDLFYSGARPDSLTTRFCLAVCRALVVTADGFVTTCFETYGEDHPLSEQFIIGKYVGDGGFSIDSNKLERHFNRTVEKIPYCEACFCKWHCAGDCAIKASAFGNVDRFKPTDRCFINQEITKFLILDRLKKSGGLLWKREKEQEKP